MIRKALLAASMIATGVSAAEPAIRTEDVTLFYKIYDAAGGHPSADQLQHDYLDKGSEGLHALARLRNVTGVRMADNLEKHPEVYIEAKSCMELLPRVK